LKVVDERLESKRYEVVFEALGEAEYELPVQLNRQRVRSIGASLAGSSVSPWSSLSAREGSLYMVKEQQYQPPRSAALCLVLTAALLRSPELFRLFAGGSQKPDLAGGKAIELSLPILAAPSARKYKSKRSLTRERGKA
jgi:hypothetical protein